MVRGRDLRRQRTGLPLGDSETRPTWSSAEVGLLSKQTLLTGEALARDDEEGGECLDLGLSSEDL